MSQPIHGRIINYRIGIRTQNSQECLIQLPMQTFAHQAGRVVGRRVVWKNGKTKLSGKIKGLHGKNGVVIAKFKKGIPGQALGTKIELME